VSTTTPAEQALLRARPHRTELNLSIFNPRTALACQVNDGSITRNARTIAYNNVTEGSYLSLEYGMTVMVGSAPGLDDYGRVRLRSATSGVLTVAENSYIDWQDDLYLTVLRYWEVWPVYPRIISDPADAENTLWYKDYDIAHTNQNLYLGAFPCAGPHRASLLDGGNTQIYWTATGTHSPAGAAYSTYWNFEGGTPSGSSAFTPGYVSYDTPGHYVTRLTVTGTNFVDTTYRYVSIYDRPYEGTDTPIKKWEISNIDGSRSEGGYTASIRVLEDITIREGDVVVIFGESWYGDTKQAIGGNASGASDIFLVGHVLKSSIQYNYKLGEVSFDIGSITQFMKEQEGFSVSVETTSNPQYWYQLYDLNIEKAVYHYLKWHSTVMLLTDIQSLVDDRPIQYFDSDRQSLYDAVDNLVRGTILGGTASDMQGKIWFEHGAHSFPSLASQTYSNSVFEIKKQDWIASPRIEENLIPKTSYIEYGGIDFEGVATGIYTPLMGDAPGNAPLYRGKSKRSQGLALKSQAELNGITGNTLANDNAKMSPIEYQMIGAYRNIDIAPQESFLLTINPEDTPRGIAISGTYIPESVSWTYNSRSQLFYPNRVSFNALVTGTAGQTIIIPEIPDDAGFSNPSLKIPNIPAISFPDYLSGLPSGGGLGSYIFFVDSDGSGSVKDSSADFPVPDDVYTMNFPSTGLYLCTYRTDLINGATTGNGIMVIQFELDGELDWDGAWDERNGSICKPYILSKMFRVDDAGYQLHIGISVAVNISYDSYYSTIEIIRLGD